MITMQHREEGLGRAHVQAIASAAGVNVDFRTGFDYGVDGSLQPVEKFGARYLESGLAIDFQSKATINWSAQPPHIVYDLEAQAYNDLIRRSIIPRSAPLILVLLCLPKDEASWAHFTSAEAILRNCCYWERISGNTTLNKYKQRIHIDQAQRFDPSSLKQLLALRQAGTL